MSWIFRGGKKSKRKVCDFWQNSPVAAKQGSFRAEGYGGLQMCVRCGAICLIALFVALRDQESNLE
jgi:hypothetical protein